MASIKMKISLPAEYPGMCVVCCRVTHQRKACDVKTCHNVADPSLARSLARKDVERLKKVIARLADSQEEFSAGEIADEYAAACSAGSVFSFMECTISGLRRNGRLRTSETYRATLNSFRRFRRGEDIMFDCIDGAVMEGFQAWLRGRGLVPNTTSFYARIMRAVYNRAVEAGLTEDCHPFRHVYTGVDHTVKRALHLSMLRKIKNADLSASPAMCFARDMFLMSFYLRGMSFVDMAYLRKTDLRSGYVVYRRRKTGRQLVIKWTQAMQQIVDRYPKNPTGYLLPLIMSTRADSRNAYRNVAYNINRNLKQIASAIGLEMPLTLYTARHSWATAAKHNGVPLSVISEGMGHDSERTTQIYLASLDTSVIDRANSMIISSL